MPAKNKGSYMNAIMAIATDKTVSTASLNSSDKNSERFGSTAKNAAQGTIEGIKVTLRTYFVKGQER